MNDKTAGGIAALILIWVLLLGLLLLRWAYGVGGFGPTRTQIVNVERLYVDSHGKGSSYMVGTDKGVFEVDNGWLLGVWNSDEIYSKLREGGKYTLTTKGNRVVGVIWQRYPYVTEAKEESP